MAKGTRRCKVCGVEYEYCHTVRKNNIFRWQDVACSPEHGSIYLARILESRKERPIEDNVAAKNDGVVTDFSDLIEDEEDELFEEDFEDEDDEAE